MPSFVYFYSFLMPCTCAFCNVLPLAFLFLLQVEVPPLMTGGTLMKEVTTASFAVPIGGVIEKVWQPTQDVQPIFSSVSLVVQDPEASQSHVSQGPQPVQSLSSTKTVLLEPMIELVLSKKPLGGASSSIQAGQTSVQLAPEATSSLELEGSEESSRKSEGQEEEAQPQEADTNFPLQLSFNFPLCISSFALFLF
ncbi:hypothetical protein ACB092_06G122900 [Castanea dentata]